MFFLFFSLLVGCRSEVAALFLRIMKEMVAWSLVNFTMSWYFRKQVSATFQIVGCDIFAITQSHV